jgi:hypothetical protein
MSGASTASEDITRLFTGAQSRSGVGLVMFIDE